jgi:cytoskeletal protein CcmA (bactofilin family)
VDCLGIYKKEILMIGKNQEVDIGGDKIYTFRHIGSFNGKIKSESINISEAGVFVGDITGGDINISGKVEGTIISDDLLNIHQSAVINGTIEYTSLKVSYGARVQGKIQHKGVVQSFNKFEENSSNEKNQENI